MAARASAQQVAKSIAALLLALCAVPAAAEDECAVAANWEVCAGSGQLCRDDDVLNSDNWRCECPRYLGFADNSVPARGVMVASSGCVRDGECVTAGTACFTANQGCLDFDGVGGNLFQCVCIPPYHCAPGIGAAADEMLLDECSSVCSTCADRGDGSGNACHTSGQLCIDPDETVPSDWECACLHPATGNATAAAAACQYPAGSECVNSTCAAAGQACRDFSLDAVKDDWRCSCVAPYSGDPAVAAPAACGINECTARCPTCAYQGVGDGGNVCLRLGQTCADPNFLVLNDWTCLCPPSTDTVVARTRDAAECAFTGECKSMYFMCGYGQYCRDPSLATVSTTWSCVCSFPFFGAAVVGGPAECFLNECAADCPTCANSVCSGNGEACVEGETNISKAASYNDWSCVCSDAVNGTSLGSPCSLDADENCVETCHVASQGCTSNDTTCTCVAPWTGDDGTPSSPLGACFLDECSLYSAVCIAGSQKCVDDDQRTLGTWRCECQCEGCVAVQWDPGATECVLDECYAVCSTCARRADGGNHTCFAAGQRCHDPNTSHHMTSDWTCLCAADAALSGAPVLAAEAACEFEQANECAEQHAAVCRPAGQACADAAGPRLHDWACRCLEPGATQIGGNVSVAQCLLDECEATCPTCAGAKCAGRGQLCVDPDPTERSLSDWYCACDAAEGKAGVRVAGTATCVQLDDCAVSFSACADAGQLCVDPNPAGPGDWVCACPNDEAISAQQAAVPSCPHSVAGDECAGTSVCDHPGQYCVDPDPGVAGDFLCRCAPPYNGTAGVAEAATCYFDECAITCATCENGLCAAAGQGCVDPAPFGNSTSDWTCVCRSDPTAAAKAGLASCGFLDECAAACPTCANGTCGAGGQLCVDARPSNDSLNDWVCECPAPTVGVAWRGVAECFYDECNATPCASDIQLCHDPDTRDATRADYVCNCTVDSRIQVGGAVAACELDECAVDPCGVGQTCEDPDFEKLADFICSCTGSGATSVNSSAACDDCLRQPCGPRQHCSDGDPTKPGDFECECDNGETATGGPANCTDECADEVCGTQLCLDANKDTPFDYICTCAQTGVPAMGSLAVCDECLLEPCAGQACDDANPVDSSPDDFVCTCPSGESRTGGPAVCSYDECVGNPCGDSQACSDPDATVLLDYTCVCTGDAGNSTGTGRAASPCGAYLDECYNCTSSSPSCPCFDAADGASLAQSCEDPNPSNDSLLDYVCRCPRPYWASSVGARVGDCTVAPTAAPRPVGDQRVFFKFRTALTKQEYSAAKLIAALARVVTLRPNGTEDVAVTQCSGCKRCEVYHIATRCLKWLATDPDGCAQLAEYETAIEANLTSTKIVSGSLAELSARLGLWMQGPATATAEGVFEFLGDSLPAKYAWAAALNDNANQAQAAADADVKLILGTVEVFPAAQTPSPPDDSDDSPSFEWWIWVAIGAVALALLVTLICCCWRQTTARRRLDATVGQKRNQASPSRAAAVTDRQAKRNGTDFMMLHEMQQLPSSATTAGNPDLVNRSPSGQSLSYGMVAAETSYTSSVDLKHPHQNPIVAVFPLSEKTMELSPPKTRNSSVFAFGQSLEGQLGLGAADDLTLVYAPIEVPDLKDLGIHLMTCGSFHSIVITTGAAVLVFGEGSDGQLGFGGRRALQTPTLVPFFEGKLPRIVVGGELHTVISCDDGLYAFGCNLDGQLGLGTTPHSLSPERVSPELFTAGAELLSCGTHHTCIVFNERLYVMGWNQHGQLGLGDTVNRIVPTECSFFNSKSILDIACGVHHTVVCCDDGLYVMGGNTFGQLGLGHDLSEMTPQVLPFFNDKVVHGISAWFHTLVSTDDGVFAFGEGAHHKLGTDPDHLDPQNVHYPRPVEAFAESDVLSVHAGCEHSAVVTSDGIFTWGNGEGGKLGHASGRPVSDPAKGRLYSLNGHKAHLLSLGVDHTLVYATPV
ncbi:Ultraviolet-B receptor UVR8 [Diplonema papillatum]|nr:Ultraviolet-B receptor UVR8 [Diplonema papillatum]